MREYRLAALAAFSIAFAIFAMATASVALLRFEESRLRTRLAERLVEPTRDVEDLYARLDELNRIADPPCSEAFLENLRTIVLRSTAIKDVAYRTSAGTYCSGLGGITNSLSLPEKPDFVGAGGWKVWTRTDLSRVPGSDTSVLDTGRFLLVRMPHRPPTRTGGFTHLSVVRIGDQGRIQTVEGPDLGLDERDLRSGAVHWARNGLIVPACLPIGWTCFALSVDWLGLLLRYGVVLVAAASGGALVGIAAGWLVLRWRANRQSLARRIRRAIRRGEFLLHYQPICDAVAGRFVSAEALMRWPQKDGTYTDPDIFIDAAEQAGLVGSLTLTALRLLGRDLGDYLHRNPKFSISLNINSSDLVDPRFHAALVDFVERWQVRPDQIPLEITERGVVDSDLAIRKTHWLREAGYTIHIDDFGTGYSNLSYLSDLAVSCVKIDRSFTQHAGDGSSRSRIVPSMLDMARELGLAVIVEGVETPDQMRYFLDRNVRMMQGWLFAHPMPAPALVRFNQNSAWTLPALSRESP